MVVVIVVGTIAKSAIWLLNTEASTDGTAKSLALYLGIVRTVYSIVGCLFLEQLPLFMSHYRLKDFKIQAQKPQKLL